MPRRAGGRTLRIVLKLLVYAAALWVAVTLIDGLDFTGDWLALIGVAAIFGIVNAFVKPLVKMLSFPVVLLTLGLFLLVINALMLWLTIALSGELGLGITSSGFGATFLGALVVSVIAWVGEGLVDRD